MRLLPIVALSIFVSTATALANAPGDVVRVRPQDSRLEQVLKEGAKRSATFKSLVDRVEASNVIVYVALNPVMKPNLSGMLTWMTRTGTFRYLRASIRPDLNFDQMIATVAHELQHAVEVIEDESVTDEKSLVALYRRIGRENSSAAPSRWETDAAQAAGFRVRRELIEAPASTIAQANIGQL